MDKTKLDEILDKHKAQPVGNGYIDIIVGRDNYNDLVTDIINSGFKIKSISWWEWCPGKKVNEYGLGGPESIYYNGWFSELPIGLDEIIFSTAATNETIIKEIVNRIETKTISFLNETVAFNKNAWLTPAVWLDVPDEWRNQYCV